MGINTRTYYALIVPNLKRMMLTRFHARIMPRKSPYTILLTGEEKASLENIARKYTSSYAKVVRAKAILMAAQGLRNDQIAQRVSLPRQIVSKWRKRFFEERLEGLENLPRTGRPPSFSP